MNWFCEVNKTDFSLRLYCLPLIYFYPFCLSNAKEDVRNSADPYVKMLRFIRTTTVVLKCTAVPRSFNKGCCWATSLSGVERRRQTFKQSPQGVHTQGKNLKKGLFRSFLNSARRVVALCLSSFRGNSVGNREQLNWPFSAG